MKDILSCAYQDRLGNEIAASRYRAFDNYKVIQCPDVLCKCATDYYAKLNNKDILTPLVQILDIISSIIVAADKAYNRQRA